MQTRIVLLILLAGLAACKSAARPLPQPVSASAAADPSMPELSTSTTKLDGGFIEVTVTIPREPAGPKPVVISPIVAEEELLRRGIAVAKFHTDWEVLRPLAQHASAPDGTSVGGAAPAAQPTPAPQGEQVGAWILAAPRPGIVGRAYFEIISLDADKTVPRVVDYLTTLPDIDPQRIALTGSSTSGFMALQAMAVEPRIAVGVVRVACGDYLTFLRSSSLALNDDPRWLPNGKLVLDPDYAVEISTREPIRYADRYPPRPLLLVAGEQDRAIPYACVERTVQRFDAAYAAKGASDRFRFVGYAQEGHNLSGTADGEVLPWLERWLLPAPGTTAASAAQ